MAAISTLIAAAGLALTAGGMYAQYQGAKKGNEAQDDALRQQQDIERQRQKQMELEATRRKREMIRQQLTARSQALATATAQGAAGSGGSAVPGAYGSISGRTNVNTLGVNQNLEIGQNIFGLNEGILGSYRAAAAAGSTSAFGAGLSSLGGGIMSNAGTLGRIGTYAFGGSKSSYGDPSA